MMPQVQVYCTVNNCYFWRQANECGADKILITTDAVGSRYPESVDANDLSMILNEAGETPVGHCQETACKTFRRQG